MLQIENAKLKAKMNQAAPAKRAAASEIEHSGEMVGGARIRLTSSCGIQMLCCQHLVCRCCLCATRRSRTSRATMGRGSARHYLSTPQLSSCRARLYTLHGAIPAAATAHCWGAWQRFFVLAHNQLFVFDHEKAARNSHLRLRGAHGTVMLLRLLLQDWARRGLPGARTFLWLRGARVMTRGKTALLVTGFSLDAQASSLREGCTSVGAS